MKKIFALILCAMLICTTPIIAYAADSPSEPVETEASVTENLPTTEEIATESENSADTAEPTLPDKIIGFITDNYEGSSFLSLAITIIVYTIFAVKKHKNLSGSIGVLNNNAVTVAENSAKTIADVMKKMAAMAEIVEGYGNTMTSMIDEIRKNAEEKESLEDMLHTVEKTLETSKMASMELANEVAELLVLANIPNAKKEELYARHRAAVDAIATAENTEVITDDEKET